jgi:uncharacterized membrane protein YqjE
MYRIDEDFAPVEERAYEGMSVGELVGQLVDETRTLIRQEVQLAKTELSEKASEITNAAIFLAAGGLVAFIGVLGLVAAAIIGLGQVVAMWLSALIIGAAILIIGGVLLMVGMGRIRDATKPPEQTIRSLKEDKEFVQREIQGRR